MIYIHADILLPFLRHTGLSTLGNFTVNSQVHIIMYAYIRLCVEIERRKFDPSTLLYIVHGFIAGVLLH